LSKRLGKFFPTQCPECQGAVEKDNGGVCVRCINKQCPAQLREKIRFYASRGAMDVEGLGDKLVDQLVASQQVKTFGDLYRLTSESLMQLERMGKKSAQKIIDGIAASKSRGLARLLNALSIRHIGTRVSQLLAGHFGSMMALQQASVESLQINEVGEIIAQHLYDWLHSEYGEQTIQDLATLGVNMEAEKTTSAITDQKFQGKTLVVTGTLQYYKRDEIENLIEQHGGRAASSVSKKTDYLVAGSDAGSKLAKAQELGVKILTEAEFMALLADTNLPS
jgi:DNA ligase (NAD+)